MSRQGADGQHSLRHNFTQQPTAVQYRAPPGSGVFPETNPQPGGITDQAPSPRALVGALTNTSLISLALCSVHRWAYRLVMLADL
jgi:hypothetical protein